MEIMDERVMRNIFSHLLTGERTTAEYTQYGILTIFRRGAKSSCSGLKPGKASGPNCIPPQVIREIASQRPELLLRMYSACLR